MKKTAAILTAMLILFTTTVSAFAECKVVTMMYHNVTNDSSKWSDWCISPDQLESDINYFMDRGYITLTASELANESMANLDGKKVLLLTFDDGYYGWYTNVYPILERCNAKATMFVVGAFVNRHGYLGESELNEIANSGLVEIGNHTDHIHQMPLDVLKNLYATGDTDDIISDLENNGAYLESITGKPVTSISWPYGYASESLDSTVKNSLGYRISFSTNFGVTHYYGDTSGLFNRINREHSKTTEQVYQIAESKF